MKIQAYGFPLEWDFDGTKVVYKNIKEICQGGPEIADLTINGTSVDGQYGGPPLFYVNRLYIPQMKKKFWGKIQFVLAEINLPDLKVCYSSNVEEIIIPDKIEGGYLFYFRDAACTQSVKIPLHAI